MSDTKPGSAEACRDLSMTFNRAGTQLRTERPRRTRCRYYRSVLVRKQTTIRYGPHRSNVGDLWLPAEGASRPPVVVLIHGGFWRAVYTKRLMNGLAKALVKRGWAAWNIEYRRLGFLGGDGGWPHTLDDVAAAIDHIACHRWCRRSDARGDLRPFGGWATRAVGGSPKSVTRRESRGQRGCDGSRRRLSCRGRRPQRGRSSRTRLGCDRTLLRRPLGAAGRTLPMLVANGPVADRGAPGARSRNERHRRASLHEREIRNPSDEARGRCSLHPCRRGRSPRDDRPRRNRMGNRRGGIAAPHRLTGRVLRLQGPIDRDDKGPMGSGSSEQVEPVGQEAGSLAAPSHHSKAVRSTRLSSEAQIRNRLFPKTRSWFALEAPLELLSPLSVVRILFGLNIVTWALATLFLHTSSVRVPAVAFIVASAVLIWLILEVVHRLDTRWLVVLLTVSSVQIALLTWAGSGTTATYVYLLSAIPVGITAALFLPYRALLGQQLVSVVGLILGLATGFGLRKGRRRCFGGRTCRPLDVHHRLFPHTDLEAPAILRQ